MTLTKVCSGLIGLGLALSVSAAQQPPGKDEKPQPQQAPPPKTQPNELEAAIAASANHPDVRLAQAKLQMAQAELDQARLQVTQRIAAAHAKLLAAKAQVGIEEVAYQNTRRLNAQKVVSAQEMQIAEQKLAQAKAALAAAEAEWNAARGQAPGQHAALTREAVAYDTAYWTANVVARLLASQHGQQTERAALAALEQATQTLAPAPGSAADKLSGLIDKRVKLGEIKGDNLSEAIEALRTAAGTDLVIRVPNNWSPVKDIHFGLAGGELPFIAWFDLILDKFNSVNLSEDRIGVYVREYGLLLTSPRFAPPGALTLAEFARQVRAQKDAPKPEPKK